MLGRMCNRATAFRRICHCALAVLIVVVAYIGFEYLRHGSDRRVARTVEACGGRVVVEPSSLAKVLGRWFYRVTEIQLHGSPAEQITDSLFRLPGLKKLVLSDAGLSMARLRAIEAELPGVRVEYRQRWKVSSKAISILAATDGSLDKFLVGDIAGDILVFDANTERSRRIVTGNSGVCSASDDVIAVLSKNQREILTFGLNTGQLMNRVDVGPQYVSDIQLVPKSLDQDALVRVAGEVQFIELDSLSNHLAVSSDSLDRDGGVVAALWQRARQVVVLSCGDAANVVSYDESFPNNIVDVKVSRNGTLLLCGRSGWKSGATLAIYDWRTGSSLQRLKDRVYGVRGVCGFPPMGNWLLRRTLDHSFLAEMRRSRFGTLRMAQSVGSGGRMRCS